MTTYVPWWPLTMAEVDQAKTFAVKVYCAGLIVLMSNRVLSHSASVSHTCDTHIYHRYDRYASR